MCILKKTPSIELLAVSEGEGVEVSELVFLLLV